MTRHPAGPARGWQRVAAAVAALLPLRAAAASNATACTHAAYSWHPPPLPGLPAAPAATEGDAVVMTWLEVVGQLRSGGGDGSGNGGRDTPVWRQLLRREVVPPRAITPPRYGSALRCASASNDTACDVTVAGATLINATAFEVHFAAATAMPPPPVPFGGADAWMTVAGAGCAALRATWLHPAQLLVCCDDATDGPGDAGSAVPTMERATVALRDVELLDVRGAAVAAEARAAAGAPGDSAIDVVTDHAALLHLRRCTWRLPVQAWSSDAEGCAATLRVATRGTHLPAGCVCADVDAATAVHVNDCAAGGVRVAPRPPLPPAAPPTAAAAPPFTGYRLEGVAAIGDTGITLAPALLPAGARAGGAWSLCMWLWQLEGGADCDAGGAARADGTCAHHSGRGYRTLFYKGHGGADQHRTPSVWLEPATDYAIVRVSSSTDADVGGRTVSPLPPRRWHHLCWTFANATHGAHAGYTATLYINGSADTTVTVPPPAVVTGNDAPLTIGASAAGAGVRGLVSEVTLTDGTLPPAAVRRLYAASAVSYHGNDSGSGEDGAAAAAAEDGADAPAAADAALPPRRNTAAWQALRWGVRAATAALASPHGSSDNDNATLLLPEAQLRRAQQYASGWVQRAAAAAAAAANTNDDAVATAASTNDDAAAAAASTTDATASLAGCYRSLPPPSAHAAVAARHSLAMLLLPVEGAALDGAGSRGATAALAQWYDAPGRDGCDEWHADAAALAAADDAATWLSGATLSIRSAWRRIMGAHAALPLPFDHNSTHPWGRDSRRAARLRAVAAARRDGAALYDLAMAVLCRVLVDDTGAAARWHPTLGDDAFAVGLLHLAAAAGEAFARPLLAHAYSGTAWSTTPPARDTTRGARAACDAAVVEVVAHQPDARAWAAWAAVHAPACGPLPPAVDAATAVHYWAWAVDAAEVYFSAPSGQPAHEFPRLATDAADSGAAEAGQRGENDDAHKLLLARADGGDADAMTAVGNLYYWGSGGMPRDLGVAYDWWQRAAARGNPAAAAAAGGMALTGVGVPRNASRGMELYTQAAAANDTRALNGLGYAYFHGSDAAPANASRAYGYFARAAALGRDADSLVNAAACLAAGWGTRRNMSAAVALYVTASTQFGSFTAGAAAGRAYLRGWPADDCSGDGNGDANGDGGAVCDAAAPDLDAATAAFRAAAVTHGPWADLVRRGFRRYLARDYVGAAARFLAAHVHGYETGAANAGYLMLRGLVALPAGRAADADVSGALFQRSLQDGAADALLPLADTLLRAAGWSLWPPAAMQAGGADGGGGEPYETAAAALYARGCAAAAASAHACYSLAALLEHGIGGRRGDAAAALAYYERARAAAPAGVLQAPAQVAIVRLRARAWLADAASWPAVLAVTHAASVASVALWRLCAAVVADTRLALAGILVCYMALSACRRARQP